VVADPGRHGQVDHDAGDGAILVEPLDFMGHAGASHSTGSWASS
jgi:hypothetical protein